VLSTIPDDILVGTNNLKLIDQIKKIVPQARVIVTAESSARAAVLYRAGADYVFLPNQLAAQHLLPAVTCLLQGAEVVLRDEEIERLCRRDEVI
jgi:Trk K+ transport system NAD-binding subunit